MPKFDPYEYIGVIIPGIVLVVVLLQLHPSIGVVLQPGLTIGEFGLIVILSVVAGHLLQALGNAYEAAVWCVFGGMPTAWAARNKTSLLTTQQLTRLESGLQADFGCSRQDLKKGRGAVRELNAMVRAKGKVDRIEAFNRSYGLMRGIASAFLVSGSLVLVQNLSDWQMAVALYVAAAIATYRMVRFGEHYAREMYVEYLRCREAPPKQAAAA